MEKEGSAYPITIRPVIFSINMLIQRRHFLVILLSNPKNNKEVETDVKIQFVVLTIYVPIYVTPGQK
ncbi:hypothetical protein HanIR_Chr17g0883951 [Helianthus annuus]|nr:hypothetical protein HanIR_Chr17g0883951 [Helianthus annuus]